MCTIISGIGYTKHRRAGLADRWRALSTSSDLSLRTVADIGAGKGTIAALSADLVSLCGCGTLRYYAFQAHIHGSGAVVSRHCGAHPTARPVLLMRLLASWRPHFSVS